MKYLICRPEGGINDILCQIQKCFTYCQNKQRVLIIDTVNSSSFCDDFSFYFKTSHPGVILSSAEEVRSNLFSGFSSVFPKVSKSDVFGLKPQYNPDLNYNLNGVSLTFDFTKDYEESVLLHHQCGGGGESKDFFRSFQFTKSICKLLFARIKTMPIKFTGFHFRGNDLPSDPECAFSILSGIRGPVFLASDSHSFISSAVRRLGSGKIYVFSQIPDLCGRPIHHENVAHETKRQLNLDAFLDLLTLALSRDVLFSTPQSGFSQLAKNLNELINASFFESKSIWLYLLLTRKRIESLSRNIVFHGLF
jgi:hypothetical protein